MRGSLRSPLILMPRAQIAEERRHALDVHPPVEFGERLAETTSRFSSA